MTKRVDQRIVHVLTFIDYIVSWYLKYVNQSCSRFDCCDYLNCTARDNSIFFHDAVDIDCYNTA